MSYPPGTGNGLKDVSLSIAGTRRRLCTASSCIPCPMCTSFLTDHRGLKLVTFVDPTDARNGHPAFRARRLDDTLARLLYPPSEPSRLRDY